MRRRQIAGGAAVVAGAAALAVALAPAAVAGGGAAKASGDARTYHVTIENLAPGQALTPALVATHRGRHLMFDVGRRASDEIRQIAENGDLGPMTALLNRNRRVASVFTAMEPLVPVANPGGTPFSSTVEFDIDARRGAHRLSWASMLICTNDGFTGLDGVRLPRRVGQTVVRHTSGYDAGTEANTEDFGDLVPPCQALIGATGDEPGTGASDPALETNMRIAHHPGITGREDLDPAVHGWTDPVAKVTITRVD